MELVVITSIKAMELLVIIYILAARSAYGRHGTASLFARASRSQKENTPRPSASELFTFLLALRAHKKPGANFLNFETCVWGVWGSLPTLPNLQYFFLL